MKINLGVVKMALSPKDQKDYFESIAVQTPQLVDKKKGAVVGAPTGDPNNMIVSYTPGAITSTGTGAGPSLIVRSKKKQKPKSNRKPVKRCKCKKK
jgi:hypothetical protein